MLVQHEVLALLGLVVTSARYQLQFRLDVNNLALVVIFNFQKNFELQLSAEVFQISQQRPFRYLQFSTDYAFHLSCYY